MSVALTGLGGGGPGEDRAVASLQVVHNEQTYDWAIYIPKDLETDLGTYIQSIESKIYADIDRKLAASESVFPDMPDYYAKRRTEYPPLTEQLDALWKGGDAAAAMSSKIQAIKEKYPKL
jgi:hypothetical protein